MKVNLKNNQGGLIQATTGFSWTYFFFGSLVPLFRGDIKWFLITLVIGFFTMGLSHFVFMFLYNGIYIKDLLQKGFTPCDDVSASVLMGKGIYAK